MKTLAARILSELVSVYPQGLTNADLATRLNANQPSIRRTIALLRAGHNVEFWRYADARGTDMVWRINVRTRIKGAV